MSIDRPILSLKRPPIKEAQHLPVNDKPPQNTNSIAELSKTLSMLVDQFPAVFASKAHSKPLKIGILEDLRACYPHISKKHFRLVLSHYTGHTSYQNALLNSKDRYDLQGHPCGVVTEKQRELARQKINRLVKQKKET